MVMMMVMVVVVVVLMAMVLLLCSGTQCPTAGKPDKSLQSLVSTEIRRRMAGEKPRSHEDVYD
eukprot:6481587-Karenia_brevis.AAC.1